MAYNGLKQLNLFDKKSSQKRSEARHRSARKTERNQLSFNFEGLEDCAIPSKIHNASLFRFYVDVQLDSGKNAMIIWAGVWSAL
jgi:hypothetical protein